VRAWLIDTGPLVAYLDAADPWHGRVVARLGDFAGQLATTSAVVTEAMHFVAASKNGARLLADFIAVSRTEVYDLCRPPELMDAALLMQKYADTPMDFADATLVLLAEALGVHDILTLDRRGFSTYRTRRRRSLRLVLDTAANRKN
jgi:predicted nucleic acid-binding protein